MNTKENKIKSYDVVLDERYGTVGSPEREAFRKEAYAYYMGQVIREARREEKITQSELGKRIGANKSYISRIENGLIDPTISTIYSIITALGLRIEIVRPVGWSLTLVRCFSARVVRLVDAETQLFFNLSSGFEENISKNDKNIHTRAFKTI